MFSENSICDFNGIPFNIEHIETRKVRVPTQSPTAFHIFRGLRVDEGYIDDLGRSELTDLHKSKDLQTPDTVLVRSFHVPKDFYAWDFILKNLYRKNEWVFNGTTHPLIAATMLENQVRLGGGPLEEGALNTFFWGALFMLTLDPMPDRRWLVQTYPAVKYPTDNPRPDELAPTNATWVREGRLFLATF